MAGIHSRETERLWEDIEWCLKLELVVGGEMLRFIKIMKELLIFSFYELFCYEICIGLTIDEY